MTCYSGLSCNRSKHCLRMGFLRFGGNKAPCGLLQAVSSDDIILQPHGSKPSVVASRGDSAGDGLLDQDCSPVLQQQTNSEETTNFSSVNSRNPEGHPDLCLPPKITLSDSPIIQDEPVIPAKHARTVSEPPSAPAGTLYDKLGGPEALEAAVDLFYEKVLDDERLKGFFEGTNMMRLVIKQVCYLTLRYLTLQHLSTSRCLAYNTLVHHIAGTSQDLTDRPCPCRHYFSANSMRSALICAFLASSSLLLCVVGL